MDYYQFTQILKQKGYNFISLYAEREVWEKDGKQYSFPFTEHVPMSIVRSIK